MPTIFQLPRSYAIDGNGRMYAGAKAYFYVTGTNTQKNTYSDFALTVPNANPLVADANGVFPIAFLLTDQRYRVTLKTIADVLIYTQDDVAGAMFTATDIGQALYPQTAAEIAASVTPTNYGYVVGHVLRYGTNTTPGTTDMTAAIQSALSVIAQQGGGEVIFPAGLFLVSSTFTVSQSGTTLRGTNGGVKWNGLTTVYQTGTVIVKKSTMTTDIIKVDGSLKFTIKDMGFYGQTGNTGDGLYFKDGQCAILENVGVAHMGGNGIRLGPRSGDVGNVNGWQFKSVTSEYNGGHGLYIYDQNTPTAPNANAGLSATLVTQGNTGNGLHNENGILNTFDGLWSQQNTGFGVSIVGNASIQMYNTINVDDIEANTAGQWSIGAQARHLIVTGPASSMPTTLDPNTSFGAVISGGQALVRGIRFALSTSVANSAAMSSYEEGPWTPVLTPGSGTITVNTSNGYYTKVGRVVHFTCYITVTSVAAPSGALTITGLPTASNGSTNNNSACSVWADSLAAGATTTLMATVGAGQTAILVRTYAAGATGNAAGFVQAASVIQVTGTYQAT